MTTTAPQTQPAPPTVAGPHKRSRSPWVRSLFGSYLPLVVVTLIVIAPMVWMILSSFKTRSEIVTTDLHFWPDSFYFGNYTQAADQLPFARIFLNSVIVTAIGAGIKLVLAIITAYALVFIRFPLKNLIFILILVALMVPPQIAIVPNYILISGLGGLNTYWGIILPGLGTAFGTFLLRQHFRSLPISILESASIDGAGHWKRLWRMVVPMSAPTVVTVGLVSIVTEWNDYLWPLIIIDKPSMMTLPVGLTLLQNTEASNTNYGVLMAGALIVIIPILLIFAFMQRYIVAGLTQGAVTG